MVIFENNLNPSSQNILLFTENFPYGTGEAFLENEVEFASKKYNLFLFPRSGHKEFNHKRNTNERAAVIRLIENEDEIKFIKKKFINVLKAFRILLIEFFNSGNKKAVYKRRRELLLRILIAQELALRIETYLQKKPINNPIFYSYWMNDWAMALAILKRKNSISNFSFRILGYDIYDERHELNYLPFRYFIYSQCKKVYCVSKSTMNYVKQKNIFAEKIDFSYLGTTDYGKNSIDNSTLFTIVSCSRFIPLKRVHLIPEILKHVTSKVHWIHIGSGPDTEKTLLAVKKLPANISYELVAHFESYNELINFYKTQPIHLFVHVSETEGLGVVHLEAMSFGIPVFTTKVGGALEFINEKTGKLFDVNFNTTDFAKAIDAFVTNPKQDNNFREGVREFWKNNFEYQKIYNDFYSNLINH